jgi:hypothetical protein
MNQPSAAGIVAEVAMIGGGALVKCGTAGLTINKQVTCDTDGSGILPDAAGQRILAVALKTGSVGDVIGCALTLAETNAAEA